MSREEGSVILKICRESRESRDSRKVNNNYNPAESLFEALETLRRKTP